MSVGSDLVVIGSVNVDHVYRMDSLPSPGETTLARGDVRVTLGGKGANQAVAVARLGFAVEFVCALGDDEAGAWAMSQLAATGVTVRAQTHGSATGKALVFVDDRTAENCIVVVPGANRDLAFDGLSADTPPRLVLAQAEVDLEIVARFFRDAPNGTVRVLNLSPICELPTSLLDCVDGIIVNEGEAKTMLSVDSDDPAELENLARSFASERQVWLVVTLGARGAVYYDARDTVVDQGFSVTAVDSVGAGDAFAGAFCAALAQGASAAEALRLATANGALATTRSGAAFGMPTRSEIKNVFGLDFAKVAGA